MQFSQEWVITSYSFMLMRLHIHVLNSIGPLYFNKSMGK